MRKVLSTLALALLPVLASAAVPDMFGIAKMTYRVSSLEMARDYYGRFLGFDEAFHYPSGKGTVYAFKVNDRQFIEVFVDEGAPSRKDKLESVSIQVASAAQVRAFLLEKQWPVSELTTDGAGEKVVTTEDADGNRVEFVEYTPEGKHLGSAGKGLPDSRISTRIHHAGLPCGNLDGEDPFWGRLLGGKEVLRYGLDDPGSGRGLRYISIGLGTECIEHYRPSDRSFGHLCFQTPDMQETLMTLHSRGRYPVAKPSIGMTRRWLLNLFSPDGARVEFTEPFTLR